MITINDKNKLDGFKFIDLFAGIGGFHYALTSFNMECVFASEWDKHAAETYRVNHGMEVNGDITEINESDIPEHDFLCAGFPCQAFSISGKQRGFEDTRGTLFFDIMRITRFHRPKVLFLENVRNIVRHDEGRTLDVIQNNILEAGYSFNYKVLCSSDYGLPQNRKRTFFVCFRNDIDSTSFKFPNATNEIVSLRDFLDLTENQSFVERDDFIMYGDEIINKKLNVLRTHPNRPVQIGIINKGGQGDRIYHIDGHAITLSAYGGGVGAKTGLYYFNNRIRKLSPRECARVQGFPESFIINSRTTQAYKQFGNSVSINVLQYIMKNIVSTLKDN